MIQGKLVVVKGKTNCQDIDLRLPMVVGRRRDSDLVIMHKSVSRQHCELFEQDGELMVRDNNSANGSFVNNRQITETALRPGDKLRVGPITFRAEFRQLSVEQPGYGDYGDVDAVASLIEEDAASAIDEVEPPPAAVEAGEEAEGDDIPSDMWGLVELEQNADELLDTGPAGAAEAADGDLEDLESAEVGSSFEFLEEFGDAGTQAEPEPEPESPAEDEGDEFLAFLSSDDDDGGDHTGEEATFNVSEGNEGDIFAAAGHADSEWEVGNVLDAARRQAEPSAGDAEGEGDAEGHADEEFDLDEVPPHELETGDANADLEAELEDVFTSEPEPAVQDNPDVDAVFAEAFGQPPPPSPEPAAEAAPPLEEDVGELQPAEELQWEEDLQPADEDAVGGAPADEDDDSGVDFEVAEEPFESQDPPEADPQHVFNEEEGALEEGEDYQSPPFAGSEPSTPQTDAEMPADETVDQIWQQMESGGEDLQGREGESEGEDFSLEHPEHLALDAVEDHSSLDAMASDADELAAEDWLNAPAGEDVALEAADESQAPAPADFGEAEADEVVDAFSEEAPAAAEDSFEPPSEAVPPEGAPATDEEGILEPAEEAILEPAQEEQPAAEAGEFEAQEPGEESWPAEQADSEASESEEPAPLEEAAGPETHEDAEKTPTDEDELGNLQDEYEGEMATEYDQEMEEEYSDEFPSELEALDSEGSSAEAGTAAEDAGEDEFTFRDLADELEDVDEVRLQDLNAGFAEEHEDSEKTPSD